MLEEKARQTYDVYVEKVELKKKLEEENKIIEEENKALIGQLDTEQGQIGREKERQAIITAEKDSLESELSEKQNKLARLEQQRAKAATDKKGKEQENIVLKKEVRDLEGVVTRQGQEKSNKDHVIKTLNDEIEERDVTINKVIFVSNIPFLAPIRSPRSHNVCLSVLQKVVCSTQSSFHLTSKSIISHSSVIHSSKLFII